MGSVGLYRSAWRPRSSVGRMTPGPHTALAVDFLWKQMAIVGWLWTAQESRIADAQTDPQCTMDPQCRMMMSLSDDVRKAAPLHVLGS